MKRLIPSVIVLTAVATIAGVSGATAASLITSKQIKDGTILMRDLAPGVRAKTTNGYKVVTSTRSGGVTTTYTTGCGEGGWVAISGGIRHGNNAALLESFPGPAKDQWTVVVGSRDTSANFTAYPYAVCVRA